MRAILVSALLASLILTPATADENPPRVQTTPFEVVYLLVRDTDLSRMRAGETVPFRILRPARDLEMPFRRLPQDPPRIVGDPGPDERQKLERIRTLQVSHGGYLLEGPMDDPSLFQYLEIPNIFGGHLEGEGELAGFVLGAAVEKVYLDPYTGNMFAGFQEQGVATVEVVASDGALLANIRGDLFAAGDLADLNDPVHEGRFVVHDPDPARGSPATLAFPEGSPGPDGYFWFREDRLAGFAGEYVKTGGSDYARYVLDAFLAASFLSEEDFRLPYLPPRAATQAAMEETPARNNLGGLSTVAYQGVGPTCAIHSVLKIVEDRDCRGAETCSAYSPTAVLTALVRPGPDGKSLYGTRRGSTFLYVTDAIAREGVCLSRYYPDISRLYSRKFPPYERLVATGEAELNRILKQGDLLHQEFVDATPESSVSFENGLPPRCAEDAARYLESPRIRRSDFIELRGVVEDLVKRGSRDGARDLAAANAGELFALLVDLLERGRLAAVAFHVRKRTAHATVAYGRRGEDFLVMDSAAGPNTAERRYSHLPAEFLRKEIFSLFFSRDAAGSADYSEPQLRHAMIFEPDHAAWPAWLGESHADRGDYEAAVRLFRRAVELDPTYSWAWERLGEALADLGRFVEALGAYLHAREEGNESAWLSRQIGYAYHMTGDHEHAEPELRRSVEMDPDEPWAWNRLAWLLLDVGRIEEAEAAMRRTVELENDAWSHRELAEILYYGGREEEARKVLLGWLDEHPDDRSDVNLGSDLMDVGALEQAKPVLEWSVEKYPDNAWARDQLARVYLRLGEREKALEVLEGLERSLLEQPGATDDPETMIDVGYVRALAGRSEEALAAVRPIVTGEEDLDARQLYNLACIHAMSGAPDEALDLLEHALRAGYRSLQWMRHDPDLESVRGDPRFEAILAPFLP